MAEHPAHHTRPVVLPSGKTIEVVYFDDGVPASHAGVSEHADSDLDLHHCQRCDSELVYPVRWEEASLTAWEVTLRCPDCEWGETAVFAQEVVDRFDLILDRGTEALVEDLNRLTAANMEDEIDRFAGALDRDLILPEDF